MSKCRIPHPRYPSYKCGKDADHTGDHVGRLGKITRHWRPYLQVFNALTGGLTR